jgi:large conductance mechanosensitive channel
VGLLQEFKEFAIKGNAVDMAVGIIIGAAFGKVVNSIVSDIIMPPIGMLIGGVNFSDLKVVLQPAEPATESAREVAEVAIRYGAFITTAIDFLIVAFTIFMVIKMMNRLMVARKKAA